MKIMVLLVLSITLIQIASADTQYVSVEPQVFQQNKPATIEIPAFENDISQCITCSCELSIKYPNGTFMVQDQATTTDNYHMTYELNGEQTLVLGEYTDVISCNNGADYGAATFSHLVTTTGNSKGNTIPLFLLLGSFLILFIALYQRNEYIGFFSGMLFIVSGIYMMIYGLGIFWDNYTRIISYISLGIGFMLSFVAVSEMFRED